ncbi:MAG: hypothetical protein ACR2HH_10850 [Chthoniobacterales bacterium]
MRPLAPERNWLRSAGFVALALLLVIAVPSADARTRRRHHPRSAFAVALQPFLLARATVHAIAEPIVFDAPRAAIRLATAPIRLAYLAPRVRPAEPPDYEEDDAPNDEVGPNEPNESSGAVPGRRAILRNGIAYPPASAPQRVKNAIWAVNTLRRKPYLWGGGHGSFNDRGYDCSGTVSFALHGAGALEAPLPSQELMRYGERGCGRWITIYSRAGHTFASIAGLRLDTTDFQFGGNTGPRWHVDGRDTRGYLARHPPGL